MLRGKLLTGHGSRFLRHALAGGGGEGRASDLSLWFPPTKVSGHYLSQWLPRLTPGAAAPPAPAPGEAAIDVEVPLPSAYDSARRAMTLDPYSPVRH